ATPAATATTASDAIATTAKRRIGNLPCCPVAPSATRTSGCDRTRVLRAYARKDGFGQLFARAWGSPCWARRGHRVERVVTRAPRPPGRPAGVHDRRHLELQRI